MYNGSMKVTISGNNTYAGGTSIAGGTLILGSSSTGGVGTITTGPLGKGTFTINGGTIYSDSATARTIQNALTIGGNVTLGNATNTGKLIFSADAALGAATRTLTVNSDVQFDGIISATGTYGISKTGSGTLTLGGPNTYTGVTTLTGGILMLLPSVTVGWRATSARRPRTHQTWFSTAAPCNTAEIPPPRIVLLPLTQARPQPSK